VKPPHAALLEELVPVDVAGFHLGGRAVAAVVQGDAGADARADLGEVQPDPRIPPDAVVGERDNVGRVDTAGACVVEDDLADGVIDQRTDPAGALAQTRQRVRNIVFPAPDVDFQ
jgi:hypothetical protein